MCVFLLIGGEKELAGCVHCVCVLVDRWEKRVSWLCPLCVCSCPQVVKKSIMENLTELCRKAGLSSLEIVSCVVRTMGMVSGFAKSPKLY